MKVSAQSFDDRWRVVCALQGVEGDELQRVEVMACEGYEEAFQTWRTLARQGDCWPALLDPSGREILSHEVVTALTDPSTGEIAEPPTGHLEPGVWRVFEDNGSGWGMRYVR